LATVGRQAAQFALAFNARDVLGGLDLQNEASTLAG
jgi:FMN reductase